MNRHSPTQARRQLARAVQAALLIAALVLGGVSSAVVAPAHAAGLPFHHAEEAAPCPHHPAQADDPRPGQLAADPSGKDGAAACVGWCCGLCSPWATAGFAEGAGFAERTCVAGAQTAARSRPPERDDPPPRPAG